MVLWQQDVCNLPLDTTSTLAQRTTTVFRYYSDYYTDGLPPQSHPILLRSAPLRQRRAVISYQWLPVCVTLYFFLKVNACRKHQIIPWSQQRSWELHTCPRSDEVRNTKFHT
jgi:hypothetical protein